MADAPDQFDAWRKALGGEIIDAGVLGVPASGFYKRHGRRWLEAVAIWRDQEGFHSKVFSGIPCAVPFEASGAEWIDENIFAWCARYPISYEIFCSVAYELKPWPPEFYTKLTGKEIALGTPWTAELGRSKLAAELAKELVRLERINQDNRAKLSRAADRKESHSTKIT